MQQRQAETPTVLVAHNQRVGSCATDYNMQQSLLQRNEDSEKLIRHV